jgi:NAD(P)-dependent dehydrogenase (short-subunit alcohol dehydrogenase family)
MEEDTGSRLPDAMPPMITKTWHSDTYPFISPTRPEVSVHGKHVLVTGGGTGIGKAIAMAFAQADASNITILGRRADRLKPAATEISAAGSSVKVATFAVDLTKRDQVVKAFDEAVAKSGSIDILVSNAGVRPNPLKPFDQMDEGLLRLGWEANVITAFNVLQAFTTHKAKDGLVVNVATASAHTQPFPWLTAYAVSKAAHLKLMESYSAEHPEIHVVSFHPGLVLTELNEGKEHPAPDAGELK